MTFRYQNVQHIRISGNIYQFDTENTVPLTLAIGLIWIKPDWWSHLDQSVSVQVVFTLHARSN